MNTRMVVNEGRSGRFLDRITKINRIKKGRCGIGWKNSACYHLIANDELV